MWPVPQACEMPPDPLHMHFQTARARELSELIGPTATMLLIDHYGGQGCYVPKKPEGSILWAVVGEAAARTLARSHGGAEIEIPLEVGAHVRWLRARGDSLERIIRRVRRAKRTIRSMLG